MKFVGFFPGVVLLVLAACHHSSGGSAFLQPGANNLGLAVLTFHLDGDTLVAAVMEAQGTGGDRNGDGDVVDAVMEIIDLRSGKKTVLPLAVNRDFRVDAGIVSFTVTECAQSADLDGDGDVDCSPVLFVHDVRAGVTTNLGLTLKSVPLSVFMTQEGTVLAFVVSELAMARDLDGDGLATHDIVHTYEADLGRLTMLPVTTRFRPVLESGRLFVAAAEASDGDRNGDGDATDDVLLVHEVATGVTQNLARAVYTMDGTSPRIGVEGPLLAVDVPESVQGVDENGDGDLLDTLVEIRDLDSGAIFPTDLPAFGLAVEGGLVWMLVPERRLDEPTGMDHDGDGESSHSVAFVYDWLTATLTNTGIAVDSIFSFPIFPPALSDRRVGFEALEKVDENGDGDTDDRFLQVFDARTGTTEPTGLAVWREAGLGMDPGTSCARPSKGSISPAASWTSARASRRDSASPRSGA